MLFLPVYESIYNGFSGFIKGEVYVPKKYLAPITSGFCTDHHFQVNSTVTTDAADVLAAPLLYFTQRNPTALDARTFQLGFKFNF